MITLLPIQEECVAATVECLKSHKTGLTVSPTGTGKTLMMAEVRSRFGALRALVVQGGDTIKNQNMSKFSRVMGLDGPVPSSVFSSFDAHQKDLSGHTIFATSLSLGKAEKNGVRPLDKLPPVDLVIVDEAHHAQARTVLDIVEKARDRNPDVMVLGLTATTARGDGQDILGVFGRVAYEMDRTKAIKAGLIVPTKVYAENLGIDDEIFRTASAADDDKAGASLMNNDRNNKFMVGKWKELAEGRPTVAFASSVQHAEDLARTFEAAGVRAAVLTGETPEVDRDQMYRDLKSGKIGVVANFNVATEGTDWPAVSCVMLAKAKMHETPYLQRIGRGQRADWDGTLGKSDNVVLDFGQSTFDYLRKMALAGVEKDLDQLTSSDKEGLAKRVHQHASNSDRQEANAQSLRNAREAARNIAPIEAFDMIAGVSSQDVFRHSSLSAGLSGVAREATVEGAPWVQVAPGALAAIKPGRIAVVSELPNGAGMVLSKVSYAQEEGRIPKVEQHSSRKFKIEDGVEVAAAVGEFMDRRRSYKPALMKQDSLKPADFMHFAALPDVRSGAIPAPDSSYKGIALLNFVLVQSVVAEHVRRFHEVQPDRRAVQASNAMVDNILKRNRPVSSL